MRKLATLHQFPREISYYMFEGNNRKKKNVSMHKVEI